MHDHTPRARWHANGGRISVSFPCRCFTPFIPPLCLSCVCVCVCLFCWIEMKEEGNITPRRETNPESERSSCRSDSVGSNPVLPVSVVSRGTRRERRNMLKSTHVIIIRFHLHFSNSNTPIQARNVYIMLPHQTDQPKRTGTGTGSEARGLKILQSDRPSIRCVILDEPGSGLPCLDWSFFVFLFVSRFRSSLLPASISLGEPLDVWIFGLRCCCCCCWLTAGAFTPV